MRVVVADTSPVNYLILIGCIDLLPRLYQRIVIPQEVLDELSALATPTQVAVWVRSLPEWIEVRQRPFGAAARKEIEALGLDAGEQAAIEVALAEPGSLLLIDESAGRAAAAQFGINHTGTLGVLVAASREGLVDLKSALDHLQRTNFRASQLLLAKLLAGATGAQR